MHRKERRTNHVAVSCRKVYLQAFLEVVREFVKVPLVSNREDKALDP